MSDLVLHTYQYAWVAPQSKDYSWAATAQLPLLNRHPLPRLCRVVLSRYIIPGVIDNKLCKVAWGNSVYNAKYFQVMMDYGKRDRLKWLSSISMHHDAVNWLSGWQGHPIIAGHAHQPLGICAARMKSRWYVGSLDVNLRCVVAIDEKVKVLSAVYQLYLLQLSSKQLAQASFKA